MRPPRERRLQLRQGQEEAITPADTTPPRLPRAPRHIVSLLPSLTGSLFDLGLGARLAGRTTECVYPPEAAALPAVGPAHSPAIERVLLLAPDLVLASAHETPPATLAALAEAGVPVWVTGPTTVREALNLLWALLRLCDAPQAGHSLAALERSYEITRQAAEDSRRTRVFYPSGPAPNAAGWLVAGRGTYAHDLLLTCGGENVLAGPDGGETAVSPGELRAAAPEVIVLPGAPGPFTEGDVVVLADQIDLPAAAAGRIYLMDGALLTWPGTHLARALAELPAVLHIPNV